MDDALEIPHPRADNIQEGDDHSSGDEDAALDWTKLPKPGAAARPIIPKRGEKDFEPATGGGSGLQLHVLDRSRGAMFEALRASRTISSKSISYGIWHPSIDRVHVTTARGIHFSTMGHFVSRMTQCGDESESRDSSSKLPKRLELLPEEALYLIERGALFCYKAASGGAPFTEPSDYESHSPGAPMSVQQAFAEMVGREEMTLERYQVYAYLKRLGFVLVRAEPPTPGYPVAPPATLFPTTQPHTLARPFTGLLPRLVSNIISVVRLFRKIDWWKRTQLLRQKTTQDIFRVLRFIPCGHAVPLYRAPVQAEVLVTRSPYKIFFHAYKPSTPFRKTAPPAPDFYIIVVDARTTTIPSLQELTALFGILPEMPLPQPRKRNVLAQTKQPGGLRQTAFHPTSSKMEPWEGSLAGTKYQPKPSWTSIFRENFWRLLSIFPSFNVVPQSQKIKPTYTPPKPNPFLALKTGKKTVVIAAVDGGNISFFRFGQGVFEEWPMI